MRKSQQGLCCVHCVCGTFNQHRSLQRRQLPHQYQVPTKAPTKAVCRVSRVLRVNVSMHFVCAFDSCIRLTTAAKVKIFPSHGKLGLNLGPPK